MATNYVDIRDEIQTARNEGRKEVLDWIRVHPLIVPDDNSITRFEPFYQVELSELKNWDKK